MHWIPTNDGWPAQSGSYIIYGRFTKDCPKKVEQAYFDRKRMAFYNLGIKAKNVTHWMLLPEPPIESTSKPV